MTWVVKILKIELEVSEKILREKVFNIAKNLKYDGYQRRLASMVYKIWIKNIWWCRYVCTVRDLSYAKKKSAAENGNISN